jgi:hypothetical protein
LAAAAAWRQQDMAGAAWQQHCRGSSSGSAEVAAAVLQWRAAWRRRQQLGGSCLAAAAWRQRVRGSRLLLVDCCLFLPPPSLLPLVYLLPPYLSLNSKIENTVLSFLINIFQSGSVCCLCECFVVMLCHLLFCIVMAKQYSLIHTRGVV